jgi:hypothetical protein
VACLTTNTQLTQLCICPRGPQAIGASRRTSRECRRVKLQLSALTSAGDRSPTCCALTVSGQPCSGSQECDFVCPLR